MMIAKTIVWTLCLVFLMLCVLEVSAQTTDFTYQGELGKGGLPANGEFDFEFKLFPAESGGTQKGTTVSHDNVQVTGGRFTVLLDFGDSSDNFDGSRRWLEISVRPGASTNPADFVTLLPRQPITATPYSLHTRGIFVSNNEDVGIGTKTPQFDLHVNRSGAPLSNPTATMGVRSAESVIGPPVEGWIYLKNSVSASNIIRESGTPLYFATDSEIGGTLTTQLIITGSGDVGIGTISPSAKLDVIGNAEISGSLDVGASAGVAGNLGVTGTLGVGTASPAAKMQVVGGTDAGPAGGGYLVLGNTSGTNLALDNNEILAINNGAVSTLYLNNDGGTVSIGSGAGGNTRLGLGTSSPSERLDLGGGNIAMGYEIVSVMSWEQTFTISCPAGKRVIGGGCDEQDNDEWLLASSPQGNTAWLCQFDTAPDSFPSYGYAICANIR